MSDPVSCDEVATIEDYAALDFKPWVKDEGDWVPPTNQEWAALADLHLVSLRIAWGFMFKTKQELLDAIEQLGAERFFTIVAQLQQSEDYFKGLHTVIAQANMRLLCAASAGVDVGAPADQQSSH